MSIARVKNWNPGDILTAFDLNSEFNNIIANPIALWSPAQQNVSFNGKIVTWDSGSVTTSNSTTGSGLLLSPGTKSGTPSVTFGSQLDIAIQVFNDTNTSANGTASKYAGTLVHAPTLSASNTGVTTTDAATVYIDGPPLAGTNETITNPWAIYVNGPMRVAGVTQFDAAIQGVYSPWSTGDGKLTLKTVADAGWVMMDDGTMGDASSGGTTRANADTAALFALLWNNIPALTVSGGRGGSAVNDYAAHKTIALPKELGRALVIAGSGAGLTARTLGNALGSEDAVTVSHTHTDAGHTHIEQVSDGVSQAPYTDGPRDSSGVNVNYAIPSVFSSADSITVTTASGTANIAASGSSGTGANMQPSSFWNVMLKL